MKIIQILTKLLLSIFIGLAIGLYFTGNPFVHLGLIISLFAIIVFIKVKMPVGVSLMAWLALDYVYGDEPLNMADYKKKVFWALANDIAVFPQMNLDPTTDKEASSLEGEFEMVLTKYFVQLYCTSVTFIPENLGERDSLGSSNKGEIFLPGSNDQVKAMARKYKNARGILILVEEDGSREVIGTEGFPCYLMPNYTGSEKKGLLLAYESESSAPGLRYDGPIPLSDGRVPPIS